MTELPTGTVTFLFTDIEGSTRLLARLGDAYGDVLAQHQRLLRAAFRRYGGCEMGREGDSFFVAFARAPDALAAAVAAQRALIRARWSAGADVRVRMGIHTGEAVLRDGDYVGIDVHRAARISAAAHGGQVLLSSATHALVADELPPNVAMHDLGAHRLKDLDRPERLFQVVAGDLPRDFPPPASVSAAGARIPVPPTPTIGRAAELARLERMLLEPGSRLVTVVGTGGVGKTRVALEAARRVAHAFRDGAHFVALAPITAHEHVASTIARQLDVVPLPSESPSAGVARHLGDRHVLLVLDNFEHLLDAAPVVVELLAAAANVRFLVTSREPLRLHAERLFRLDPLVEDAVAAELFVAVAQTRDAGFVLDEDGARAVTQVCRRLDRLPLAIELAAARVGVVTVHELEARLRDGFDALGAGPRDAPARQQTLTATLQWSYGLLSPEERAALAAVAIFAGGCTIDAAQAVTGASLDTLDALVAKNLVVRRTSPGGPSRLMLLETIADFARDRLAESGQRDAVAERHFSHYLAIATRAREAMRHDDSRVLPAELDVELHNLRAALAWALDRRAPERALRLATALEEYWDVRALEHEGAHWLRAALALPGDVPVSLRAEGLQLLADCLAEPATADEAVAAARESLDLARSIGDIRQCAASTFQLADIALTIHALDDAYRHATEAERLAAEALDERTRLSAAQIRALVSPSLDEALAIGASVAAEHRRAGNRRRLAMLQTSLTYSAMYHGDFIAAERLDAEALESAHASGDPHALCYAYGNHGLVELFAGDSANAADAFARELRLAEEHRYDRMLYEPISGLAAVAALRGDDQLAARLYGAAEKTGSDRHDPVIDRRLDERCFAASRARLGEPSWRAVQDAGASLTPRDAVAAALDAYERLRSVAV